MYIPIKSRNSMFSNIVFTKLSKQIFVFDVFNFGILIFWLRFSGLRSWLSLLRGIFAPFFLLSPVLSSSAPRSCYRLALQDLQGESASQFSTCPNVKMGYV